MAKKRVVVKKKRHPQLPTPVVRKTVRKARAPRAKREPESINITKASDVQVQKHICMAMEANPRSGTRARVYDLGNNAITPNKKIKKEMKPVRYGSKHGLGGPASDFAAPIVRAAPRGVSDIRQLLINAPNNEMPDEFGITNKNRMPMQTIVPTPGGKHSGRTGPIR